MKKIFYKIKNSDLYIRIAKAIIFGIGGAVFAKGITLLINIRC